MSKKKIFSFEINMKVINLKEKGWSFRVIAKEKVIKNVSQPKQWWKCYYDGEINSPS